MIDINELRRLAQAATPGGWYVEHGNYVYGCKDVTDGEEEWHPVIACADDGEPVNYEGNAAFIAAANPAAISELLDRLEAAENENAKLRIALAEKVTSEATLRDLSVGNGFINATFEEGAVQPILDALADQFVESGASNYIEMQLHSKAALSLLLTLQRVDGKTPHQLRAEAEKERDDLRAKIEAMERQRPVRLVFRSDELDEQIRRATDPEWAEKIEVPEGMVALYAAPGAKGEEK